MKKTVCFGMTMAAMAAALMPTQVFAAEVDAKSNLMHDIIINKDAECSLNIKKYDITSAMKDGVWDWDSFMSTGQQESYVEDALGNAVKPGNAGVEDDLGNGSKSNGYAIKGVEFTYLKVADVVTFTQPQAESANHASNVQLVYAINKVKGADLLSAIGLANGKDANVEASKSATLDNENNWYYDASTLNKAMSAALADNSTVVKNALETYVRDNGGTKMALTDENGHTVADQLPVGLYLVAETMVPEQVTSTVNPFLVSLPMTTFKGDGNSSHLNDPQQWNYDVYVYPKNETGIPTLEKTVRESKADTGKNNGSAGITDGFDHFATGSAGDVMEYQIISTLPTITSEATMLKEYYFKDRISAGLTYNKALKDVKIEVFSDKNCTEKVATWTQADEVPKFTVDYEDIPATPTRLTDSEGQKFEWVEAMNIKMTQEGLNEINGKTDNVNGNIYAGYSNYTMRITYSATVDSDNSLVLGDGNNENAVTLQWKRTNDEHWDTLVDDAHVYSFAIDLTKKFSDKDTTDAAKDLYKHVKFKVQNKTDGYWLKAEYSEEDDAYYVTGHTPNEDEGSVFSPSDKANISHMIINGCEDDEYIIKEIQTADGYTLLSEPITVKIDVKEGTAHCGIYMADVNGVVQNDEYYKTDGGHDLHLANIPQKEVAHKLMTASASVNGNDTTMDKENSTVSLSVVNTKGFDLPPSGDVGTWMYGAFGVGIMAAAAGAIMFVIRKKDNDE